MLNIKFHPIHSELASNWRQRGRTRLVWMTDVNSASKNRVKIVVVETESAPSRHNVAKNPERIRIFSRIKRREFSSKKKKIAQGYPLDVRLNLIEEGKFELICNPLLFERKLSLSRNSVDVNNRHELPATPRFHHFETARLLQFCCNNAIVWTFASIFLAYTMEQYIYTVRWNSLSLRYVTPFDIT